MVLSNSPERQTNRDKLFKLFKFWIYLYLYFIFWRKLKQKQEAEEAYLKEQQIPGAVLYLKGFNHEATRENLKELFDSFAKIKWVDFSKGQDDGYVRFMEKHTAKLALEKALEKFNGELSLKGAKLEAKVLEGNDESDYWKDLIKKLGEQRSNKKSFNNKKRNKRNGDRNFTKNDKKRSFDDTFNEDRLNEDNNIKPEIEGSENKKIKN